LEASNYIPRCGDPRSCPVVLEYNGRSRCRSLTIASSTIEGNGTGIAIEAFATATRFGDNHIKDNGTDVKFGTLTNVGTQ
jgi:hypothetical protein